MNDKSIKIGQELLERRLISQEQLLEALSIQKEDKRMLGQILLAQGFLSDEALTEALADIYQIPFINLNQAKIDQSVIDLIPIDILRRHNVLPVRLENQNLFIAIHDPLDLSAIQEIQYITGHQPQLYLATLKDICTHLDKFVDTVHTLHGSREQAHTDDDDVPVINLVDSIISSAITERASDIHLEPQKDNMRVRFRIDGTLYEKNLVTKTLQRQVISRLKIISGMDVTDTRRPQDGRFTPEKYPQYNCRVSTLPDILGENMVIRLLNRNTTALSFEELGMSPEETHKIKTLSASPHGIILLTGPTGAGKTTTLYSILNFLNQIEKCIITVEDPVEYQLPGINQTNINNLAGYSFASAIRNILRHDPDIIMIGEIRDTETAEIAIRAALTGHLVLSTLHTNSAAGAIMRLLDMNIAPFLLRASLIGVIAQRLVRRLCPHCHTEYEASDDICHSIEGSISPGATLASAGQCEKCFQTGFHGRVGLYEILQINDPIRELILESPNKEAITKLAVSQGMKTLRTAGYNKALAKLTTLEEVLSITGTE